MSKNPHAKMAQAYLEDLCSRIDGGLPLRPIREWWKVGAAATLAVGLALSAGACGSSDSSTPTDEESYADDNGSEYLASKADAASGKYVKAGTYVNANTSPKTGELTFISLVKNTYHGLVATTPGLPPTMIDGTYRYARSGNTQYLLLKKNGATVYKYAFKQDSSGKLQLRLVNTKNWLTFNKAAGSCGSRGSEPCPENYECVDIPGTTCGQAEDCGGQCIPQAAPPGQVCTGLGQPTTYCPAGTHCEIVERGGDVIGQCVPDIVAMYAAPGPITTCGGFLGIQCPTGMDCQDIPDDGCDPKSGGADCAGQCVVTTDPPPNTKPCGPSQDQLTKTCTGLGQPTKTCGDGEHCEVKVKGGDVVASCVADSSVLICPASEHCETKSDGSTFCFPNIVAAYAAPVEVATACGGFAGIPCPPDYDCVDNPEDGCDPAAGGADCGGICAKKVTPQ